MNEKSKSDIQEAINLQNKLEDWQDGNPHKGTLSISICMNPEDKQQPYSAVASLNGTQGLLLAGLEHMIKVCPHMVELMSIAIEKSRHRQTPCN